MGHLPPGEWSHMAMAKCIKGVSKSILPVKTQMFGVQSEAHSVEGSYLDSSLVMGVLGVTWIKSTKVSYPVPFNSQVRQDLEYLNSDCIWKNALMHRLINQLDQ